MSDQGKGNPAGVITRRAPHDVTPNACTQCRRVKMKCLFADGRQVCDRCLRLGHNCIREQHRRGRKVGTRLRKKISSLPSDAAISISTVTKRQHSSSERKRDDTSSSTETENAPIERTDGAWEQGLLANLGGFQPPDLLHKRDANGRFSLEIVLSSGGVNTSRHVPIPSSETAPLARTATDPITLGILNRSVAVSLFEEFMHKFNVWVWQFDPVLHTFDYVRNSSSFLMTTILAAAARAFNPSLKLPLQEHAEKLFLQHFNMGAKSVEIAHAIMVMMTWKEPEDTRAWSFVGHAIRMGHELGWHMLQHSRNPHRAVPGSILADDLQRRKERDVQRVWLLLFVYDRNLSFQTGNPWMIERSDFLLETGDDWFRDPQATVNDPMLCALVALRLLISETFRPSHAQLCGRGLGPNASQFDRRGSLVRIVLHDVDKWQKQWLRQPAISQCPCHCFIVRFYGAHLRLFLSSNPLETSLASAPATLMRGRPTDTRALWLSFASAVDMLDTLSDDAIQGDLYFAPDSVHVETAYASVFLVKLCLQLPVEVSTELADTIEKSLRKAIRVFSAQAAPSNTGCALQATFLGNILRVFEKGVRYKQDPRWERDKRDEHLHNDESTQDLDSHGEPSIHSELPVALDTPCTSTPPSRQEAISGQQHLGTSTAAEDGPPASQRATEYGGMAREHCENGRDIPASTAAMPMSLPALDEDNWSAMDQATWPSAINNNIYLLDDDAWAAMLNDAGFSIVSGTFLPS